MANSKEYHKQLKQQRRERGLCTRCGYVKNSAEHMHCFAREQNRRKQYLEKGVCRSHPGRLAISKYECEECWFRSMSKTALGSRRDWETVKNLFDRQNGLCAYTGKALIKGVSASLDHKVPKIRGGMRVLENIHFVDKEINKLKTWLTHDEFLLLCKKSWEQPSDNPTSLLLAQIFQYTSKISQK